MQRRLKGGKRGREGSSWNRWIWGPQCRRPTSRKPRASFFCPPKHIPVWKTPTGLQLFFPFSWVRSKCGSSEGLNQPG